MTGHSAPPVLPGYERRRSALTRDPAMPQTVHVERHFTAGEVVRDIVIGRGGGVRHCPGDRVMRHEDTSREMPLKRQNGTVHFLHDVYGRDQQLEPQRQKQLEHPVPAGRLSAGPANGTAP